MPRYAPLAIILILVCGLAGLAANILPVAGAYPLTERTSMLDFKFPNGEKAYDAFKKPSTKKPDALKLDIPMLDKAF